MEERVWQLVYVHEVGQGHHKYQNTGVDGVAYGQQWRPEARRRDWRVARRIADNTTPGQLEHALSALGQRAASLSFSEKKMR